MAAHNDFFTWQSLATFAGTTTAVTAVTNGISLIARSYGKSFRHEAILGLGLSILFCLFVAVLDTTSGNLDLHRPVAAYFIAVVNGFFVFSSASGMSAGGHALVHGKRGGGYIGLGPGAIKPPTTSAARGFFQRWF